MPYLMTSVISGPGAFLEENIWGKVPSNRVPGRSPGRKRILAYFEAHRRLLFVCCWCDLPSYYRLTTCKNDGPILKAICRPMFGKCWDIVGPIMGPSNVIPVVCCTCSLLCCFPKTYAAKFSIKLSSKSKNDRRK